MPLHPEAASLRDRRVLVVEDDYILAMSMSEAIQDYDGFVVGPVSSVEAALKALECDDPPDAAVLDIRLQEELSFPIVAVLRNRGVPVFFITGYDDWFLPQELDEVAVYQKPMDPENVVRLLNDAIPSKTCS